MPFIAGKQTVQDPQSRRSMREIERLLTINTIPIGLTKVPTQQAVPVGGLVLSGKGPSAQTSYGADTIVSLNYGYASANAYVTPSPAVFLYIGCQYEITMSLTNAKQITNASTDSQVYVLDTGSLLATTDLQLISPVPLNGNASGSLSVIVTPTATISETFAVHAQAAPVSLQIGANGIRLFVKRVA